MIIRVQAPEGTRKLTVDGDGSYGSFLNVVSDNFQLNRDDSWYLSKTHCESDRFKCSLNTKLAKIGLKHGDLLFLIGANLADKSDFSKPAAINSYKEAGRTTDPGSKSVVYIVEDKIDQQLAKMDGKIKRKLNDQLCHHPPTGQCIHCVPLEPYDSAYLEMLDPPVKYMSFHAYIRKLSGGQSNGKYVSLENTGYCVRPGCREHPPWPEGICTKCQPNPVTLERQPYRHVDYVQFENGQMVETFLDFWRHTGCQRIGLMLGRYELFDTVGAAPLAMKAVVVAIYEPLQEFTTRSIRLTAPLDSLMTPEAAEVASRLGLRPVGWIFTDLVAEDAPNNGQVKHFRGTIDTFFLSAEECITAAHLQNLHPNICSLSPDSVFGSKFVSVVVTGDASKQIHFEAYQVSNQAMALQRDGLLVPTYDAPELGYIRETTRQQFIPEVFYSTKDKYNNRVTRIARPLPVEFLLVDMPAAFPICPKYTMAQLPAEHSVRDRFPVENRATLGQIQDFAAFSRHLSKLGPRQLRTALVNFHLLAWLAANKALPMHLHQQAEDSHSNGSPEAGHSLTGLLDAIVSADGDAHQQTVAVDKWAATSPAWATVMMLVDTTAADSSFASPGSVTKTIPPVSFQPKMSSVATDPLPSHSDRSGPSESSGVGGSAEKLDHWPCLYCTFHNSHESTECEMCGLPQHG